MNEEEDAPKNLDIVTNGLEAEIYAGARWRKPTDEEIDELAQFFAEDLLIDSPFEDEMDSTELLIRMIKEKERIVKELETLTMVLDLEKIEVQIFHTYLFSIEITPASKKFILLDQPCRVLKQNGIVRNYTRDDIIEI